MWFLPKLIEFVIVFHFQVLIVNFSKNKDYYHCSRKLFTAAFHHLQHLGITINFKGQIHYGLQKNSLPLFFM